MNRKPLVYLAAPYTHGVQSINVHSQVRVFNELLDDGMVTPFAPLIGSHLVNLIKPAGYEFWMEYDFDVIAHCDALFAQRAEHLPLEYIETRSDGVARELDFCHQHKIPIFFNKADLYAWSESRSVSGSNGTNQRPENSASCPRRDTNF